MRRNSQGNPEVAVLHLLDGRTLHAYAGEEFCYDAGAWSFTRGEDLYIVPKEAIAYVVERHG